MKTKKQFPLTLGIALGVVVLAVFWVISSYNSLVTLEENTNKAFSDVETDLERRFALIPNLVNTVKGAADFEQETFTAVTEARTKWLNAGTQSEKIEASNMLQGALSRLLVTVENYPELKATEAFRDLQVQLEGTENRIAVSRKRYNEVANSYNKAIKFFPKNLIAAMFGFDRKDLFESTEGAQNAPTVNFD